MGGSGRRLFRFELLGFDMELDISFSLSFLYATTILIICFVLLISALLVKLSLVHYHCIPILVAVHSYATRLFLAFGLHCSMGLLDW